MFGVRSHRHFVAQHKAIASMAQWRYSRFAAQTFMWARSKGSGSESDCLNSECFLGL